MASLKRLVFALVMLALLDPAGRAEDWPQFGRSSTRNSVSPEKHPPLFWQFEERDEKSMLLKAARNIKWSASLGTHTKGDPVIANGLVWVGTNNHHPRDPKVKGPAAVLMCFRESDGEFLYQYVTSIPKGDRSWELSFSGHSSSPAIEGERMWFTTVFGETVCLDIGPLQRGTGQPREVWKLDMRKELGVFPSPPMMGYGRTCSISAPYKGFIYVLTGNGVNLDGDVANPKASSLLCLDKDSGKVIWSDNSPGKNILDGQFSSPLVAEINGKGQVIAPMGDGIVRSFDALSGNLLWEFDVNPKAVARDSESRLWNNICASPVFYEGLIYIATGNQLLNPIRGGPGWIYCLDPDGRGDISLERASAEGKIEPNPNARVKWRFGGRDDTKRVRFGGTMANLVIAQGLVIAADAHGYVNCLDSRSGALYWKHDCKAEISGTPLIVEGKVFVASSDEILIFEISKKKTLLRQIEALSQVFCGPVYANDVLYLAANDTLYAIPGAETSTADWPQFGRDSTRNPVSREKAPPLFWQFEERDDKGKVSKESRNILWSAPLGRATKGDPVIANGLVWIGTNAETRGARRGGPALCCFRAASGLLLYEYVTAIPNDFDQRVFGHASSPAIEAGHIWFTTPVGEVVCLDIRPLEAGKGMPRELWKVDMRKEHGVAINAEPHGWGRTCSISTPYKNLIYVSTGNGPDQNGDIANPKAPSLICLDKRSGKLVWADASPGKSIMDGQFASPLVIEVGGGAQVILPTGDGYVRSFDALTGKPLWQCDLNPKAVERSLDSRDWNNICATPVYYDKHVYIGTGNLPDGSVRFGPGWLYCLDPTRSGDISLELKRPDGSIQPNPNSGVKWHFGGQDEKKRARFGGTTGNVAIDEGLLIVGDARGYVLCFDARSGTLYWKHDVLAGIVASPLIADGKVFVGSDSAISLFELSKRKKLLNEIEFQAASHCAPVFARGILYLATNQALHAIAGSEGPRHGEDWPQFGRDSSRNAVSPEKDPPHWCDKNIKWTRPLGSITYGDPVIVNGMLWVGTNNLGFSGGKKEPDASVLACLDTRTGRLLHRYVSPRLASGRINDWPHSSMACSPLIDGDRMWFTTNRCEVVCLDIAKFADGLGEPEVLWKVDMIRDQGVFPHGAAMALCRHCSIAGYKDFIYVITGNGVDETNTNVPAPDAPSLLCLEKKSGRVVWKDASPGKNILHGQWGSPLVVELKGQAQVIAPFGDGLLRSFDAVTGKLLWQFDTNPKDAEYRIGGGGTRNYLLATPVYSEGRVYIGNGQHPEHQNGLAWLYCIDPTKTGDISHELSDGPGKAKPNPNSGMVWRFGGLAPEGEKRRLRFDRTVSNVAVHQGFVIAPDIGGLVHCLDAKDGRAHWSVDTGAAILGSPLIVDKRVYIGNESGVWILALADKSKVLGEIEMPERVRCSPVFAHGVLYVVAGHKLYAIAGDEKEEAGSDAGHWPQWRGPDRTNIARDTGLLKSWPKEGPPLAWKAEGLGRGARSIAVARGLIFTLGYEKEREFLIALHESTGRPAWRLDMGPAIMDNPLMQWLSQRTPTVDEDRVYAVNAAGVLLCVDADHGKERWRKDYAEEFGGAPGPWGFSDYPLVDGDKLICTAGGERSTVVALEKRTGKTIWTCGVAGEVKGTHAPVVAATIAGTRMYIHQLGKGTVGIAAADGKVLWQYTPTGHVYGNVQAALVRDDLVFCANGWTPGSALLKLKRDGETWKTEVVWKTKARLDPWLGSSVLLGDDIHTSCGARIDWKTGKELERVNTEIRSPQRWTMVCVNDYLIHRTGENKIILTEITPKEYVRRGEFNAPRSSDAPTWIFPIIAGGKLYLRDQDVLLCYDLRDKKDRLRPPDAIFVPTPQDVVEKMLDLAGVGKEDIVYDLGCGDGRIVVTAAKKYGCKAVGFDLDVFCVKLALEKVRAEKLGELVKIEQKDLFDVDLKDADVVALYLLPRLNVKLLPQLRRLKAGARIVSHQFPIEGMVPERVVRHRSSEDGVEHTLYLWRMPGRAPGAAVKGRSGAS